MFRQDQKRVYQQLNGEVNNYVKPDAGESKHFEIISGIDKAYHRKDSFAEWLRELRACKDDRKQENIALTVEMVTQQTRKIPNWKCLGPDGVQWYWLKNLTELHMRIAAQLNELLNSRAEFPSWMNEGKTILCQKNPGRGNAIDNYRPITCLPLMLKLLTGMMSNALYDFMENSGKLPNEQKGCRRKSRGTKDQLLIDKTVLNDCRKRHYSGDGVD